MPPESTSVAGGTVVRSYADDGYPPELQPILDDAIADLAGRLTVDASAIGIVEVQEVTWNDASLGCPEPGMSYAQMIVDGLRILLTVDGAEYDYHSGGTTDPFLCEPATGGRDARDGQPKLDVEVGEDGEVTVTPVPRPDTTESGPTQGLDPPEV